MGGCTDWQRPDDEGKGHESKHTETGDGSCLEPSKALTLPATELRLCSFKTPRPWSFVPATVGSPPSGG